MKAVYILGNGSVWQNNEIRYSIRSLKYVPFIDDVIVVGECPDWLKVKHIYVYDGPNRVENIWRKMEVIAEHIEEPFLFMNDDMFFTREVKLLPWYYEGMIQDKIDGCDGLKASGKYRDMLIRTKQALFGGPELNFAVHYPIILDPTYIKLLIATYGTKDNLSFRCMYGNIFDLPFTPIEYRADCKLWKYEDYTGQDIFSISDRFLSKKGEELFEQLYPEKSQWEIY